MRTNFLIILCALHSIDAIFMLTLPSAEVEKKFEELAKDRPYIMMSPNDASSMLAGVEDDLHDVKIGDAKNLVDLADSLNLTILVKALEKTGLDNIIDHEGDFTLFAPTNEAFDRIPQWAKKIPLRELLKFHVARGLVYDEDIENELQVRSLLAKRDIRLNIYKNGKLMTANGAKIISVNYKAHNGVLHMIDRLMLSIYEREGTVVKELGRCPVFKTLSKLVEIAQLGDDLSSQGPFTIFAPTDDAFAKLSPDVVKRLVENPSILRQVLLYHVAAGSWFSAGLEDGMQLDSLQKSKLAVSIRGDTVTVGNVTVTVADAMASNGVIHSVDQILMPPSIEKKLAKMVKTAKLKGINGD